MTDTPKAGHNGITTPEEWRPVSMCADYEVSNLGRVRRATLGRGTYVGRLLSISISNCGYQYVGLNGRRVTVHQLVCAAFHGPAPSGRHIVAHHDGSRTNNTPANLRWATQSENIEDAKRHGTYVHPRGEIQGGVRLASADIPRIRALSAAGISQSKIATTFAVSRSTISAVVTGRNWRHISGTPLGEAALRGAAAK